MKSEMTVQKAQQLKKELENTFIMYIKAFENETGCSVESVRLLCVKSTGCQSRVQGLDVDCSL